MQQYSTYKPSGIEWLGDVPSHWKIVRIKDLLKDFGGDGFPIEKQGKKEGDFPFLKVSDINGKDDFVSTANNYIDEKELKQNGWKIIPVFSMITAKVGEALKKNHRKINLVDCCIDNNMMGLVIDDNKKLGMKYFFYLSKEIDFDFFEKPGTVPSLNMVLFRHYKIPQPLFNEQTAIASYLDQATANIDKVIATKQQQLEKLERYKKSKIHECVTKGLNPNIKFKDSGIEWIGVIPERWKVERIKDVVELRNIKTSEKSEEKDYIELEDIEQGTGRIIGFRDTTEVSSDVTIFKKGDVLFGKLRPYLAKYWLADRDGKCTGEIISFNCLKIYNAFFKYFIGSPKFIEICTAVSYGAKMPRVDWTRQIAYFYIAFPNIKEQKEIAEYLDNFCTNITNEKNIIEKQITCLQQYRKSLIHECVTGKRKVI
ncbi:MAG: restriction endonuclease subunit S [Bacteroidales bacterium]|jgi:restriction endonuclease S subunit